METPKYNYSSLTSEIDTMLRKQHPQAFAIANFGEGPMVRYRGQVCFVQVLSVHFCQGKEPVCTLSHLSEPPYLLLMARKKGSPSLSIVFFGNGQDPLLESDGDETLTGQILVRSFSAGGDQQVIIHAVSIPGQSHIFAPVNWNASLLMDGNPEICRHLLLCGKLIDNLFAASVADAYVPQATAKSLPQCRAWEEMEMC